MQREPHGTILVGCKSGTIADSSASTMSAESMPPSAASPIHPAVWSIMAVTWLVTILISAVGLVYRDTINRVTWDTVWLCLLFGLFYGTALFIVSGSLQAGVLLIISVTQPRRSIHHGMLAAPLLVVALLTAWGLSPRYVRSYQPDLFTSILHKPCPKDLNLIAWGHGFGLQDKRHFWMFEGTAEQFIIFKSTMGLQKADPDECSISNRAMKQAIAACPADDPWILGDTYYWDEETSEPIFANRGFVMVDRNQRRWLVWWEAI